MNDENLSLTSPTVPKILKINLIASIVLKHSYKLCIICVYYCVLFVCIICVYYLLWAYMCIYCKGHVRNSRWSSCHLPRSSVFTECPPFLTPINILIFYFLFPTIFLSLIFFIIIKNIPFHIQIFPIFLFDFNLITLSYSFLHVCASVPDVHRVILSTCSSITGCQGVEWYLHCNAEDFPVCSLLIL